MATAQRDLWPATLPTPEVTPPLSILREQASLLESKTNGLVKAEVRSSGKLSSLYENGERFKEERPEFRHSFYLVAPALEDYRYLLFDVIHPVEKMYPLVINDPPHRKRKIKDESDFVHSEEEFKDALKKIFASEKTLKVIQALIAQSSL
jgi:hypothetical protein